MAPVVQLAVPERSSTPLPADPTSRPVVRALAGVTFLQWLGASVGLPLLPVYLEDRGASSVTVGLVVASYFAAGVLFQYALGRSVDRVGAAPVLRAGLIIFAIGGLSLALPIAPGLYALSRALEGIGAGAAAVAALAMIGVVVPAGQRGRAFAAIYGSQLAGMAVGPLIGSLIGAFSVTAVFVAGGLISLLAWIPLAVLRRRVGPLALTPAVPPEADPQITEAQSTHASWLARRVLIGAVVAAAAFGLTIGVYETCWTLLLTDEGAATWQVGLSWTLFALPFVVAARPAGRLADTVDRRLLVVRLLRHRAGLLRRLPVPAQPGAASDAGCGRSGRDSRGDTRGAVAAEPGDASQPDRAGAGPVRDGGDRDDGAGRRRQRLAVRGTSVAAFRRGRHPGHHAHRDAAGDLGRGAGPGQPGDRRHVRQGSP